MRRHEKKITDKKVIEAILEHADVCRIAMAKGDQPYLVPVNFVFQGNAICFHSAKEGKKIEILKKNPKVWIEVDTGFSLVRGEVGCDWGANYQSVMGAGVAGFIDDPEEKRTILEALMKKYSGRDGWEYNPGVFERTSVIRIDLEEITGKQAGDDVS